MIKTNSPVRNPWSQFCSVHINNEEKKEKKKRKEVQAAGDKPTASVASRPS